MDMQKSRLFLSHGTVLLSYELCFCFGESNRDFTISHFLRFLKESVASLTTFLRLLARFMPFFMASPCRFFFSFVIASILRFLSLIRLVHTNL